MTRTQHAQRCRTHRSPKALGNSIEQLSPEELLELASKQRAELKAAGEIDRVADEQPGTPPPRRLVRWLLTRDLLGALLGRYWRTPTAEEIAKGDKRKKIQEEIWCEGEVVLACRQRHEDH